MACALFLWSGVFMLLAVQVTNTSIQPGLTYVDTSRADVDVLLVLSVVIFLSFNVFLVTLVVVRCRAITLWDKKSKVVYLMGLAVHGIFFASLVVGVFNAKYA